jgi:hypothetical protein
LTAEDISVAAAFEVSYRYLNLGRQRFARLLGVHPGATADVYAAAALEGLLTETGYGRYGMHDLIRRYARDLAADLPAGV